MARGHVADRSTKRLGWTIRLTDTVELAIRTDIVVRTPKAFRLPGRRPRRSHRYRALVGLAYALVVTAMLTVALAMPAAGLLAPPPASRAALPRLPASAAEPAVAPYSLVVRPNPITVARAEPPGLSTHLVARGETLLSVAARYGISPQTLAYNNGLSDSAQVRPGRTLVITPPNVAVYSVREGETLEGIATRFGADADAVRALNGIAFEPADLVTGRTLVVPVADSRYPGFRLTLSDSPRFLSPKLRLPVDAGVITQRFSPGHTGVDIAAPVGTPILAADAGTVTASGWHAFTGGLHVCVLHDWGLETCGYHAYALLVEVGERVLRGQPIALVGSTGHSTGPHVHWEAHANGALLDPLTWVGDRDHAAVTSSPLRGR
jgi:murein DD-endopeptidase MepM/ murein hydrolase activator NlpD